MSNARLISRNFVATLVTQLLSWALAFAVTMYLPRYAGTEGMGRLAVAGSFMAIFGVLASLGTSSVMIKEIARDHSRAGELLGAALMVRVPLAFLLGAVGYGTACLLNYGSDLRVFILVAAIGMVFGLVNDALGAVLQGMEKLTRQSLGVLTDKFLLSTLVIVFVFTKQPLWTIAAVGMVTSVVSSAVHISNLRTFPFAIPKLPGFSVLRSLIADGIPFVSLGVFTTLYGQSDPFILQLLTSDQTVGWYSVALRLVGTTMFIPTAITSALTPTLSRLYSRDIPQFRNLARRMLTTSAIFAVPIALILVFGASPIIRHLYPSDFDGAIPVLQVGGGASFLYYMTVIFGSVIVASDRQNRLLGIFSKSLFIGVPGCFLFTYLGHRYFGNGAAGAILSDTLMEAYIFTSLAGVLKDIISLRETLALIGRLLLAAAPMTLILSYISWMGISLTAFRSLLGLFVGLAIYVLGCLLLRCINIKEFTDVIHGIVRQRNPVTSA